MTTNKLILIGALALLGACSRDPAPSSTSSDAEPPTPDSTTSSDAPPPEPIPKRVPNDLFLAGGELTFVRGTAGDARADRGVAAQVGFIRELLFPEAKVLDDTALDVAAGPGAWPANPIVYGGPHVNGALAALAPTLPFALDAEALDIGGESFEGRGIRLIALVPAREPDADGPGYPEFLLYAGTGAPGVAEINGVSHGAEPILVADRFGRLVTGEWTRGADGQVAAKLSGPVAPRPRWRATTREQGPLRVEFMFFATREPDADEPALVAAGMRGISTAVEALGVGEAPGLGVGELTIYVYPDAQTKQQLTGSGGDGNALVCARSIHVRTFDPSPGGGFERLLAHEATHVLAYDAWGASGSMLLGEGLAVWAAAQYGGRSLDEWRGQVEAVDVEQLLGAGFSKLPESRSYPLAGLFVRAAVAELGRDAVRDHLFGATPSSWAEACERAGTTPAALTAAYEAAIAPPA